MNCNSQKINIDDHFRDVTKTIEIEIKSCKLEMTKWHHRLEITNQMEITNCDTLQKRKEVKRTKLSKKG